MAEFISYRAGLTLLQDRLTHVHDPMFRFSAEPITIERGVDDSLTVVDAKCLQEGGVCQTGALAAPTLGRPPSPRWPSEAV